MIISYLLCFIPFFGISSAYFVINKWYKNRIKDIAKFNKRYLRIVSIASIIMLFLSIFHIQGIMKAVPVSSSSTSFKNDVGCLNLIGEPYGDNRIGNFFAWLSIALYYPSAVFALISSFYKSKNNRFINRFIVLPILSILALTIFNLRAALVGQDDSTYKTIFIGITIGLVLSVSLLNAFNDEWEKIKIKELIYGLVFFLICIICFLPSYTYATLLSTDMKIFGTTEIYLRVYDFSIVHRIALYIAFIFPLLLYFYTRSKDENTRTTIVLMASFGALTIFLCAYGSFSLFSDTANGYQINVTRLPIHLCHTALYIVPICVIFKLKKLFYFTYFINVFGALMAMFWPNVGETRNIFDPEIPMFWYNHINAFFAPLICVGLKIFPRPKFKDVIHSLLFFGLYYILIVFLNGWLSNYVSGFKPGVVGTGTDYLFINNTYILDNVFGKQSRVLMDIKWEFKINDLIFVYYPVYQSLFFVSYIAIAFGMWYVYALFFNIADSHGDTLNRLKDNYHRLKAFRKDKGKSIDHDIPLVELKDFCKIYDGNNFYSAKNVNIKVKGGQIFGFIGPNGAGKSTCIKSIIGLQDKTSGRVLISNYDMEFESKQAKSFIGYVPDHYYLFEELTGREYINYIADQYNVAISDRNERIEFYSEILVMKEALDQRIDTYSHGMKQKITIIASLIHEPRVWILDEPLTGLDPESIYQVKECMRAYAKKGNIVFFSSHLIDVVEKLCTHIAIIKKGEIVYQGPLKEGMDIENKFFAQAGEGSL